MYSRWTQHLTNDADKEQFKKEIQGAWKVLSRLKQMMDEDVNMLDRSENNQKIYDLPNWDYRQAHKNGVRQAYTEMKSLVNLDQQKG